MSRAKDIGELRDQLLDAFDLVKNDPRRAGQVQEMSNAAGKIIATLKTQLEYSLLRGELPEIGFMGKTSGKPIAVTARRLLGS
jgi:hypothetical protein